MSGLSAAVGPRLAVVAGWSEEVATQQPISATAEARGAKTLDRAIDFFGFCGQDEPMQRFLTFIGCAFFGLAVGLSALLAFGYSSSYLADNPHSNWAPAICAIVGVIVYRLLHVAYVDELGWKLAEERVSEYEARSSQAAKQRR